MPERLSGVHNVFHVSHLRKHVYDSEQIIETAAQDDLEIEPNLAVIRRPIRIMDQDEKQLRRKVVRLVKVQWSGDVDDCTWETEDRMRKAYTEFRINV